MYSLNELEALVGKVIYTSDTKSYNQHDLQAFSDLTGDRQWIHIDVDRCSKEGIFPKKKPVVFGLQTISAHGTNMLLAFPKSTVFLTEVSEVKFSRPVYVDDEIYETCKLLSVKDSSDKTFELMIEGATWQKNRNKLCLKITMKIFMCKGVPATREKEEHVSN